MDDELQQKQCMISKIDEILQIELAKFQSDKDAIAKYRELYLQFFRNAKNATITSSAFFATVLISTVAFKVFPQFQGYAIILLFMDVFVVVFAFAIFSSQLRVSSRGWMKIEDTYNAAISDLQDLRIFVSQKVLTINSVEEEQLEILSYYSRIYSYKNRIEIHKALLFAWESVYTSSYTVEILKHQLHKIETLLSRDEEIMVECKSKFETKKDLYELDISRVKPTNYPREGGQCTSVGLRTIDKFFDRVAKRFW